MPVLAAYLSVSVATIKMFLITSPVLINWYSHGNRMSLVPRDI